MLSAVVPARLIEGGETMDDRFMGCAGYAMIVLGLAGAVVVLVGAIRHLAKTWK